MTGTNQIIFLVEAIYSSLDLKLEVRCVYLDMSKIIDKVWQEGLIEILIDGNLSVFFESYLCNKKHCAHKLFESEWGVIEAGVIEAGVPEGSVLGPLPFFIYILMTQKIV